MNVGSACGWCGLLLVCRPPPLASAQEGRADQARVALGRVALSKWASQSSGGVGPPLCRALAVAVRRARNATMRAVSRCVGVM